MFKIEYLSSYNISFRDEVLCLHWISIEIMPRPTFRALQNTSAEMLHFLMHICEYRMTCN